VTSPAGPPAPGTAPGRRPLAGLGSEPGRELATRVALVVALVCLLQPGLPSRIAVLSAIVVVVLLVASARWRVAWPTVIVLAAIGIALRLQPPTGFSDVLVVTEAAIREVLAGGNPYGHGFEASVPPGAPYAYGPLALLWYLPALGGATRVELLVDGIVLIALAVRGRPLGLAIFAVMPALIATVSDGSNDHSAGLLILVALLAALRWPLAGAVLLAIATAFKPYALAWLPGLIGYAGGVAPLLAFVAASVAVWLLPVLSWTADALLWSFRRADALHAQPYYSLAYALGGEWLPQPAWQVLRVAAGIVLAVVSLRAVRSGAAFIIAGTLVFAATLFLGWWGTFAYLAAVAPVLCWHLDDWLGLGVGRVVWPGDPVGVLTDRVDRRWPIRPVRRPPSVMETSNGCDRVGAPSGPTSSLPNAAH
jgi:hypothetical protein